MENNTNEEVKQEVKEPVKSEKELRKEKWRKFVFGDEKDKKEKVPLDKQDKLCYAGAAFFLIMALVPILLRNFDPTYQEGGRVEENPNVEIKDIVKKISCTKTVTETKYKYEVQINGKYKNNAPQELEIMYTIILDPAGGLEYKDVAILEYTNISGIQSAGIIKNDNNSKRTIKIDYNKDNTLKNNQFLKQHSKALGEQRQIYQDNDYHCSILEV